MNRVVVQGYGAVSPAGWGAAALNSALARGEPIGVREVACASPDQLLKVRPTPPPAKRPEFIVHPRLRRTSPISQYVVASALEALGNEVEAIRTGRLRLGIVFCAMIGCVNYSRRFYDETLKDPSTASPLLFPETVYNAPASHLAALLGATGACYTLVGDPGVFLQGLALAAEWVQDGRIDRGLVVGAEEVDWLAAHAVHLFDPDVVMSDGGGAILLAPRLESEQAPSLELRAISDPHLFTNAVSRNAAALNTRHQMEPCPPGELLCDGLVGAERTDAAEATAWHDWTGPRISPKRLLGEGLTAAVAWQCVAALDCLASVRHASATVSVVGCNEQAIAARFARIS